jgi:hypothetical protein
LVICRLRCLFSGPVGRGLADPRCSADHWFLPSSK